MALATLCAKKITTYSKLIRIDRPIGILLLFLPCLFGVFLSLKKHPDILISPYFVAKIVILFLLGSITMRSAGCIINDFFDRKFDKDISRTKSRPLATGEVSKKEALFLTLFLLVIGLIILLQFNTPTIISGFAALILVILYPLMKRITYYPQIFLGLTFNFGVIMASLVINERISFSALILYSACIIWTVIYDTIYAYQDVTDDLLVGVKSTAVKFHRNPKAFLYSLVLLMLIILIFLGIYNHFNFGFFGIISLSIALLYKEITLCNLGNASQCEKVFKANYHVGLLILIAIALA